jgi:hypothetical protein
MGSNRAADILSHVRYRRSLVPWQSRGSVAIRLVCCCHGDTFFSHKTMIWEGTRERFLDLHQGCSNSTLSCVPNGRLASESYFQIDDQIVTPSKKP